MDQRAGACRYPGISRVPVADEETLSSVLIAEMSVTVNRAQLVTSSRNVLAPRRSFPAHRSVERRVPGSRPMRWGGGYGSPDCVDRRERLSLEPRRGSPSNCRERCVPSWLYANESRIAPYAESSALPANADASIMALRSQECAARRFQEFCEGSRANRPCAARAMPWSSGCVRFGW
jgi:hypothetical protein